MKNVMAFSFLLIIASSSFAQPIPSQSLEDSVIGWKKVYHFKGAKEPTKIDHRTYSIAQLSICDSLLNWMQASYVPKGGLGDAKKTVSEKLGQYNQNTAALPQAYGAWAKTYTELRYNSSKKLEAASNSHELWNVMANAPIGIPADALCTPTQYLFTLPTFEEQGYGKELPALYGLATHPNTSKYFTYFRRNSNVGNEKTVILCKDNKLPFIKVTKGEYLQITEDGVKRLYENEKKNIYEQNKGDQKNIDYFMKYLNEKNEKRIACLQNNKVKYKNRLQEPAQIFTDEPDVMLENYPDIFEGTGGSGLKLFVYKIDPAVAELCKTDKPQWIRITWHGDLTTPTGKHQHESIINNFNFDYVYNFFFDPEKVKGQPYKPLRSPVYKETVTTMASDISKKNAADKSIHFFDDFSSTLPGKTPADWRSAGSEYTSVTKKLDEADGTWIVIAGNDITPKSLKKPLPQNFTVSYDLAASQNFTWGAHGLTLKLANGTPGNFNSSLELRLRPGFDGRGGEVYLDRNFPNSRGSKWADAAGFSNNKKINRVHVTLKKSGEKLEVFSDDTKVIELEKAIPATQVFNFVEFGGGASEGATFYISNIKITKD